MRELASRPVVPRELRRFRVRLDRSGYVETVRQAQAAGDWRLVGRPLSDHWLDLYLGGRGATLVELMDWLPPAGRAV
jgi:hypothetical protein